MSPFQSERSKQAGPTENKQKRSTVHIFHWKQTCCSPLRLAMLGSVPLAICSLLPSHSWSSCASPVLHPNQLSSCIFPATAEPAHPLQLPIPAPQRHRAVWQTRWIKRCGLKIIPLKQPCKGALSPPHQENHTCYSQTWCHNTRCKLSALEPHTKAES